MALRPLKKLNRLAAHKDYFRVPVAITVDQVVIDPSTVPNSWTVVAADADPALGTWKDGTWEVDGTDTLARTLIGPGGNFELARGSTYDVYLRLTDTPEVPTYGPWRITAT